MKLGRNPFARHTILRKQTEGKCCWCDGQNGNKKVYIYKVEPDFGRSYEIKETFCSIGCCNSYHEK